MLATAYPAAFPAAFPAGGATSSQVPAVYPVSIDGHGYTVDWTEYQRQLLESQRPAFDNHAEPGEQTLNPQSFWRRSQSRFDLGAGQVFFDNEQSDVYPQPFFGSARQRYWASKGLNPWDGDSISLLRDVEQISSTADTNLLMLTVGDFLYVAGGDSLVVIDMTNPSSFGGTTGPADFTSITTDGVNVYVAYGGGNNIDSVVVGDLTPSLVAFGALEPTLIRYANGRMIAALSGDLVELDNAGVQVGSALVDPQFGGTWADIVGTPVGIFAAVNSGEYRGELYIIDIDTESTGLLPGRFAGRLPNGELFNSLYFYGGAIVAGTSRGLRVFELAGQNGQTAEMQPVIEIPGGVTAMAGLGEFVWFGWSNYDSVSTGLGRLRMNRSTDPDATVPPYASDLMATAQGTVTSIAIGPSAGGADPPIVFAVAGSGFYRSNADDELVASGTLDSGWVRFGTLAEKSIVGVELGHDPLDGTIDVTLVDFDGSTDDIGVSDTSGATFSEVFATSRKTRAVKVQLTITRDGSDSTIGPALRWWTLLGYPAPGRAREITLPVILRDQVIGMNGHKIPVDVLAEYEHLESLASSGQLITYQEFDKTEQAIVVWVGTPADKNLEQPQLGRASTRRWLQGTHLVRLLTKES